MKQTLTELFDQCNVQELDVLLENLTFEEPDELTMARIRTHVRTDRPPGHTKAKARRTIAAAAACFVFLVAAVGGTYAYAAEAKEYHAAALFFEDHDLSTAGLSRGEIKAVYRDITTQSFTYSKTAEVIANSLSDHSTGGFEITQAAPTPEDVENLWNYKNFNAQYGSSQAEDYRIRIVEKLDPELGFDVLDRCYFERYDGDDPVWSVSYTEFWIENYVPVSDGVIVYGLTDTWSSEQPRPAWISKIDPSGTILWTRKLEHGFQKESVCAVLEHDDGSYAVFSRGELSFFCLSRLDRNGNQTAFHQTEVGNYGIWNAARFGDGYLVQLGSYVTNEQAKIVKVDADGAITDSFSYTGEDQHYYISDMIEFGGNIYLSAYAVPRGEETYPYSGGHYEVVGILDQLLDSNRYDIPDEELTPMVRDNYTAVLLVCDPHEGVPREFYSIQGSLGGTLAISETGQLLWDVESITTTEFSPYTSAYSIRGTSYVFRYTFDQSGVLVGQEKTGETAPFYR